MTSNTRNLSDQLLRRALSELAADADGSVLLTAVLRSVDSTAQVRRRPWAVPDWGRASLLLAAVLLITAALGAAVALSALWPQPEPKPSTPALVPDAITVSDFVVPFTYSLPPGETRRLGPRGRLHPIVMYARADGDPTKSPTRVLRLFAVTPWVHTCSVRDSTVHLTTEPVAFMEALREAVGVGLGPISPTTLGNLPALTAETDPRSGTCAQAALHEDGFVFGLQKDEPILSYPSTLIVARTGVSTPRTIGVLISAPTAEDYAVWLPIALAYVESFVFDTTGG